MRMFLVNLPFAAMVLTGCVVTSVSANPGCKMGAVVRVEGYPASIVLPAGAVIDSQNHDSPPTTATDSYQLIAHIVSDAATIRDFYRCSLPASGFPIIDEEQGNLWLLRFGGSGVDDGTVLVGNGAAKGVISIQISLIATER